VAAEIWRKVQFLGLRGLIGDLHVAEQAVGPDLDLGTVAGSDLDLPVAQEAEPTFSHAASSRNAEHKITGDTDKGLRGPRPGTTCRVEGRFSRDRGGCPARRWIWVGPP
jgi:hypothetical protein